MYVSIFDNYSHLLLSYNNILNKKKNECNNCININ